MRAALAAVPEAVPVDNPGWSGGMGSSLRAGLASLAAMEPEVSAVLVMLVDQPRIGAAAVARVLAAHRAGAGLVSAAYSGERGHPVLFAREHWEGVAQAAEGDRGARGYLRRHADAVALVECSDIAAPRRHRHPGGSPPARWVVSPCAPPWHRGSGRVSRHRHTIELPP
ncbi:hypothetical protein GCM10020000_16660 [Streptomyces olivoverticillatus]